MHEDAQNLELVEVLNLQRAMARGALGPGPDAIWPEVETLVSPVHQAAMERFQRRLLIYRELVRTSLWDPVEAVFPITRALLGDEAWAVCREAFLAAHAVQSCHYRDIPATYVGWLAEQHWGEARWPSLLQLAHLELVEILATCAPDPSAEWLLHPDPEPNLRVRLHPSAHLLTYTYAVHRATVASPEAEAVPTHLLAFRDEEDQYQLMELTPATCALLARAQQECLAAAMTALALSDPAPAFKLLIDLRHRGALLGFEP